MIAPLLALLLSGTDQQMPVPPRIIDCGPGAVTARVALTSARRAAGRRDWRAADRVLIAGTAALGDEYRQPSMVDDTGMHLIVANIAARKGQFARAASVRRRVLTERLSLCAAGPSTRR